jgi:hypothetical protein
MHRSQVPPGYSFPRGMSPLARPTRERRGAGVAGTLSPGLLPPAKPPLARPTLSAETGAAPAGRGTFSTTWLPLLGPVASAGGGDTLS